jgi:oligoendopeptidase F
LSEDATVGRAQEVVMTKEGNKMRWDMESIFPGGSASAEFERFRKAITDDLEKAKKTLAGLPRKIDDESTQAWVDLMLSLQEIKQRRDHAESFAYCLSAQDVNDEGAMGILEQMMSMYAASEAIKSGVADW